MKKVILMGSVLMALIAGTTSCDKKCENASGACNDTPPNNELCTAAFNRWFYNSSTNTCTLIAYSGCNQKGFETQAECEACKCKK